MQTKSKTFATTWTHTWRRNDIVCFVYLLLEHFCRDNNKTRYLFKCYSPEIIIIVIINASIHLIYGIHSLGPARCRCALRKFACTQTTANEKAKPKHSHKLRTNDELFIRNILYIRIPFACEASAVSIRNFSSNGGAEEMWNEVNSFRWWLQTWNYSNKKQPLKIIWHGKWFFIKSVSFRWMDLPFYAIFLIYTRILLSSWNALQATSPPPPPSIDATSLLFMRMCC